jgi:hypothetical protein
MSDDRDDLVIVTSELTSKEAEARIEELMKGFDDVIKPRLPMPGEIFILAAARLLLIAITGSADDPNLMAKHVADQIVRVVAQHVKKGAAH